MILQMKQKIIWETVVSQAFSVYLVKILWFQIKFLWMKLFKLV